MIVLSVLLGFILFGITASIIVPILTALVDIDIKIGLWVIFIAMLAGAIYGDIFFRF